MSHNCPLLDDVSHVYVQKLSQTDLDLDWKIRTRKQKKNIGKLSFLNRTIQLWDPLPADASEALFYKLCKFRKRVRKVMN
jgi:hypothetical protein